MRYVHHTKFIYFGFYIAFNSLSALHGSPATCSPSDDDVERPNSSMITRDDDVALLRMCCISRISTMKLDAWVSAG